MTGLQLVPREGFKAKVWSWVPEGELLDDEGVAEQIANIASLPCAVHVAVMPDAHKGYGMPIGCVLATHKAVVPYAVGVDIGCGMIAVETDIPIAHATPEFVALALSGIFARVPVGQPTKQNRNQGSYQARQDSNVLRQWLEARGSRDPESLQVRERADRQLGTLGGGNHFIEIQTDGERVWLMLHTGSRMFGKFICDHYHKQAVRWTDRYYTPLPTNELAFLSMDTEDGNDYMIDMGFAMRFAEESRNHILERCIEAMGVVWGDFSVLQRIETHHNFAAVERHMGRDVMVHRKGAVSTAAGDLVTIPGSMQTGSYIARAIPNVLALNTCAHGAGRRMGRNATKRANEGVDIKAEMLAAGILLVNPEGSDALDEAGRAYKDVEAVMQYQSDLASPVTHLRPLGVVKG